MIYTGFNMDSFDHELYICHGANDFSAGPVMTTGEPPSLLFNATVVCHGEDLYLVGGRSGYDVKRINLRSLVWETLYVSEQNYILDVWRVAIDGESIFVFGNSGFVPDGLTLGLTVSFRQILIFNIDKKEWTTKNTVGDSNLSSYDEYPTADIDEFDFCKSHLDNELRLVISKYEENCKVTIWKIDLKIFQWTRICEVAFTTRPKVVASAISPDGIKHHIIGFSGAPPDVFVTWLGIPKLSEMCWEAVLHYLKVFDKKELICAGVPLHYVNRIE